MSRAKRRKQYTAQQKAAEAILDGRDLEKKPLTANEILALPRNQRPPRSEWPIEMLENPKPYAKRKDSGYSSPFSSLNNSGGAFFDIIVFLGLWAICSFVFYGIYNLLHLPDITCIILGIISGLFAAIMLRTGNFSGTDVTNWW